MTWSSSIRSKAAVLRQSGLSLTAIRREVGVSKSTLHEWFKEVKPPNTLYYQDRQKWFPVIQSQAVEAIRKKKKDKINSIVQSVQEELQGWDYGKDIRNLKAILSILYWAEGQKLPESSAPVKFANTDPRLVLLFVTLLEKCYAIDRCRLRVMLYLHWYHNEREVKDFWKQLLGISEKQFRKTYHKKRSKTKRFRKNFMGICFVIYQDVYLRKRLVHTAYEFQKTLCPGYNTVAAPVA